MLAAHVDPSQNLEFTFTVLCFHNLSLWVQLILGNWLGVGRCSVEVRLAYSSMGTVFTTTMCDQAWLG